ncbi:MAG: hypothetical protein R2708_27165 [Vicinamibacterales bacterium]
MDRRCRLSLRGARVSRRRTEVAALLTAFDRGQDHASRFPAEARAIMAGREGLTPGECAASPGQGGRFVSAADQAAFMGPGVPVSGVVRDADRILRLGGQLRTPARTDEVVSHAVAASVQTP